MSKLSEEEIIDNINKRLDELKTPDGNYTEGIFRVADVQGLLDLYLCEKSYRVYYQDRLGLLKEDEKNNWIKKIIFTKIK